VLVVLSSRTCSLLFHLLKMHHAENARNKRTHEIGTAEGVMNDASRSLIASSSGLSRVHVLSNHSEKEGRLLVSSEEPTGLEHCQRDLHPKTIVTPIYLYIWRTNAIRFASWSTSGHIRNEEQRGSLAGVKHYPTNACPYGVLATVWRQSSCLLAHG